MLKSLSGEKSQVLNTLLCTNLHNHFPPFNNTITICMNKLCRPCNNMLEGSFENSKSYKNRLSVQDLSCMHSFNLKIGHSSCDLLGNETF